MLRISPASYESLRVNHLERLKERLAVWLRGVSPKAAAAPDAALAGFVSDTIAFADSHAIADEDALQALLELRERPNFPRQLTREHEAVLARSGFSDLQRVTALGRSLSATTRTRRVTLDMDFAAERRRRD